MKFEKWDESKYSDLVPDFFSGDVVEPESIGKYREIVEDALRDVEDVYGVEANFNVVFAEINIEKMKNKYGDDVPPNAFF